MTTHGTPAPQHRSGEVAIDDVQFIMRSAGERTAGAALELLHAQLGPRAAGRACVISERPFSRAVRRTLEIGAESGRAWTVGIDADVLLMSDGVEKLLTMCRTAKPGSFTVTGLMLCRFYGGFVFRGVHCYRSGLLATAAGLVGVRAAGGPDPESKPESAVVHAMARHGHGYEGHPVVLAVHDYEQSLRHIYLKLRQRARREVAGGDVEALRRYCAERAAADRDFEVALWGIEDGVVDAHHTRSAEMDWFAAWPEFDARMDARGWAEKTALPASIMRGYADRVVASHDLSTDTRTPRWIAEHLTRRAAA